MSARARSLVPLLLLLPVAHGLCPPQLQRPAARRAFVLAAADSDAGASVASSTVNLVKTTVGAGVLSLPVGISAFSSSRAALLPSVVLVGVIGAVSAYCFAMVGRACELTASRSWAEAWARSVGARTAWVPAVAVALLCFSATLQYTMVIGDSFSSIFSAAGLPAPLASRTGAIALVTLLGTLPLSLLPSLEMLKYTSSLGIGGILYTAAFMAARAAGPAYAPGSPLLEAVPAALRPRFSAAPFALSSLLRPKVFVLLSILATSYCSHFLAPQFYNELAAPAPPPPARPSSSAAGASKLPRFGALTAGGFAISAALSAAVMAAGFLTFGGASDGYILNNYAASDRGAQLARLAIGGSIVATYPLLHQGLRDTLLEALRRRGHAPVRAAALEPAPRARARAGSAPPSPPRRSRASRSRVRRSRSSPPSAWRCATWAPSPPSRARW